MAAMSVMLILRRRMRFGSLAFSRMAVPSLERSLSKPLFDCPDDGLQSESGVLRPVIRDGFSLFENM